jgi:hypothetical protein
MLFSQERKRVYIHKVKKINLNKKIKMKILLSLIINIVIIKIIQTENSENKSPKGWETIFVV